MNRQELLTRTKGINAWLRSNLHTESYKGVLAYQQRLLKLLYNSKVTN